VVEGVDLLVEAVDEEDLVVVIEEDLVVDEEEIEEDVVETIVEIAIGNTVFNQQRDYGTLRGRSLFGR
jgi:hypothetical protein